MSGYRARIDWTRDPADLARAIAKTGEPVSYTHLRAHETVLDLVCRLLLEKKKKTYKHTDTLLNTNTKDTHRHTIL